MRDSIVFFQIKDPAAHPLTRIGYTSINSDGRLIVYCTDEGPLDGQYRTLWLDWRRKNEAAKKDRESEQARAKEAKAQHDQDRADGDKARKKKDDPQE